jgi:phosphate transport system permease protein
MLPLTLLGIVVIAIGGFALARSRAVLVADGNLSSLHSRPGYHGLYMLLRVLMFGLGAYILVNIIGSTLVGSQMRATLTELAPDLTGLKADTALSDARAIATGTIASKTDALREALAETFLRIDGQRIWAIAIVSILAALGAAYTTFRQIKPGFRARNRAERVMRRGLMVTAAVAILTTIGILLSLIGETLNFFSGIDWRVDAFLFGTTWSPLSGVHEGSISADKVGAIPLFAGTLMITVIAMLVAVPVGLFAAIYLSEFASPMVRAWAKPMLEILAGIPTVVYGFFAAITVAPALVSFGGSLGLTVQAESALAAGVVMGIMIIPFISSLSDDVINAVPQALRDGSFGLGATRSETVMKVVLPAALPGIVSAVLLGISRAVGETMIVVMAVGQSANLTWNPLDKVTTVTVQIVMLILGDTEASTAAGPAYTLGFTLFVATLALNVFALRIVSKYRQKYD